VANYLGNREPGNVERRNTSEEKIFTLEARGDLVGGESKCEVDVSRLCMRRHERGRGTV
jgi:hypothetical protein